MLGPGFVPPVTAMPPKIADALLFFAPELWGEVERFSHLCSRTYAFDDRAQRALAGVRQHFEKAVKLLQPKS